MPASGAAANGHHHPHPHPSPFTATALAGHHPHHPFNYSFHSDASCPECRQLERSPRAPVASYFDEAFRTSPSPPPTSFLANILNPADASPPPADRRARVLPRSPTPTWASCASRVHASMPPTRQQTGRLPNGYVDLTTASPPAPDAAAERAPRRPKRKSPTPGPSTKRQKRDDGAAIRRPKKEPEADIEEIDLSDDKGDFLEVLQKQRAEAVKAQQRPEEKATTFNSFTCVICMDTPTDLTATSCGAYLFLRYSRTY
ncbi:hypothetical protein BDV95DRAFT_581856 [Massariosphaeria phaeospora]|uniref:Uncharacterized protein n=1 Tax=Massariosphaeria phaeospora TaxID=100035 RepID=A0A7C8MEZ4_9PLEO|nr:hypothetical protein BDV95DRAFT_581856 [Massariosphaeria phaeospora]